MLELNGSLASSCAAVSASNLHIYENMLPRVGSAEGRLRLAGVLLAAAGYFGNEFRAVTHMASQGYSMFDFTSLNSDCVA